MEWRRSVPSRRAVPSPQEQASGISHQPNPHRRSLQPSPVRFDILRSNSEAVANKAELGRTLSLPSKFIGSSKVNAAAIDELLNEGKRAMEIPNSNTTTAIDKWQLALKIANQCEDTLREAKAFGNIAVLYRSTGKLEPAKEYIERAWSLTNAYIRRAAKQGDAGPWLQLVIRATGLEGLEQAFMTHSSASTPNSIGKNNEEDLQVFQGPPIVVWILQLMTNMGNICYSRGKYDSAIKCYSTCKRLVDALFEEFPPPREIVSMYLAIQKGEKISNKMKKNRLIRRSSYKLSYVHRQALLTHAISLSHMGVCFGALGFSTTCLQYQCVANDFLQGITALVPDLLPSANQNQAEPVTNLQLSNYVIKIKAVLAANLGLGWHLNGDFAKEVFWHQKSLELFENYGSQFVKEGATRLVGLLEIRQKSQLGASYIQLGSFMKSAKWLTSQKIAKTADYFTTPEASKYWKNGLHSEDWTTADRVIDRGLAILYEQAHRQMIYKDWTALYITWLNIATGYLLVDKTELAIHYIARVFAANTQTNLDYQNEFTRKPPLPNSCHLEVYMLLCQCFFNCLIYNIEADRSDLQGIQAFLSLSIPLLNIDLIQMDREMVIKFYNKVAEKIQATTIQAKSSFVTPHVRLIYPFNEFSFDSHEFNYKVDYLKSMLLTLALTKTKLYLQSTCNEYEESNEAADMANTAINEGIQAVVGNGFRSNVAFLLLNGIADHLESSKTISPSLVKGLFSFKEYAFMADLYGFCMNRSKLGLLMKMRIAETNMVEARNGLLQASRYLILSALNICAHCFEKMEDQDVCLIVDKVEEKYLVPCSHGFSIESK